MKKINSDLIKTELIHNLTLAKNNKDDQDLGELDIDFDDNKNKNFGINKGELYAYSFPSQGEKA